MFLLFEGFQIQNAFTLLLLSKKHSYLLTVKITPCFLTLVIGYYGYWQYGIF